MKYCTKCGAQVEDDALYCPKCGHKFVIEAEAEPVNETKENQPETAKKPAKVGRRDEGMCQVGLVFCIVACVLWGFALIPLIWMIPLTVSVYNSLKNKQPISLAMKVIVTIFVSLIGGILLLVGDDFEL